MDYNETLEYVFAQLPAYQRVGKAAYKANLGTTLGLDSYFGHPHQKYRSIHVAGTNGKGSVSHLLASVLQSAGYKTGLYTSPHLKDFRERVRVNGIPVSEDYVVRFVQEHKTKFEEVKPSFFEMTVALAFKCFADEQVDIAVIEVGMGGRLDSTNIISPEVSVITNIGFDHTAFLGETIAEIAGEKAGIIKERIPVVIGERHKESDKVFVEKAKEKGTSVLFAEDRYMCVLSTVVFEDQKYLQNFSVDREGDSAYSDLKCELLGLYQRKNVLTALAAIDLLVAKGLSIEKESVYTGFRCVVSQTGIQGRWQMLGYNPMIVCDTAHNVDGIKEVVQQIKQIPFKQLHIVLGLVNDKDIGRIMPLWPKDALFYFTKATIERALDETTLAKKAGECGLKGQSYETVGKAFEAAQKNAGEHDLIFVGGSTFIVAEVV